MPSQLLANVAASAAVYALLGISFGIIHSISGFFHFAHGAIFALGGYAAFVASSASGGGFFFSAGIGVVAAGFIGLLLQISVYAPLRDRGASPTALLVASIGLFVLIEGLISLGLGQGTHSFPSKMDGVVAFAGARLSLVQLVGVVLAILAVCVTDLTIKRSGFGLAVRAVGEDEELASISGVPVSRIRALVFLAGSGLAGLAGVLEGIDVDLTPTMGMNAILAAVVVSIVGGAGSPIGIAVAALGLAGLEAAVVWFFGGQWENAVAVAVLVCVLLIWPSGIRGRQLSTRRV